MGFISLFPAQRWFLLGRTSFVPAGHSLLNKLQQFLRRPNVNSFLKTVMREELLEFVQQRRGPWQQNGTQAENRAGQETN